MLQGDASNSVAHGAYAADVGEVLLRAAFAPQVHATVSEGSFTAYKIIYSAVDEKPGV